MIKLRVGIILLVAVPMAAQSEPRQASIRNVMAVAPPDQLNVEQALETGKLSNRQRASYRSMAILADAVILNGAPTKLHASDRLIEMASKGRDAPSSMFCRVLDRTTENEALALACLADADRDGRFDQLWIGSASSAAPVIPYESVRFIGEVSPTGFTLDQPNQGESFSLGVYVSGSNPLFGLHNFYMGLANDGGSIPIIRSHQSTRVFSDPRPLNLLGATFKVSRYKGQPYRVQTVQPWPSAVEVYDDWPKVSMMTFLPG